MSANEQAIERPAGAPHGEVAESGSGLPMSKAPLAEERARAAEVMRALLALALVRTAFSSQRSLMAWMRTSVSLYTFGFSITKFTEYLDQSEQGVEFSGSPRLLGLILIAMGILATVLATFEHSRRIQMMKQLGLSNTSRSYLPTVAALTLCVIGIVTLGGIALNWSV